MPLTVSTAALSTAKYITAVALFGSSLFFCFLPQILKKNTKRANVYLQLGQCLAAGVFLAAGLVHLLPEAVALVNPSGTEAYPYVYLAALCGFAIIFLLDIGLEQSSSARRKRKPEQSTVYVVASSHNDNNNGNNAIFNGDGVCDSVGVSVNRHHTQRSKSQFGSDEVIVSGSKRRQQQHQHKQQHQQQQNCNRLNMSGSVSLASVQIDSVLGTADANNTKKGSSTWKEKISVKEPLLQQQQQHQTHIDFNNSNNDNTLSRQNSNSSVLSTLSSTHSSTSSTHLLPIRTASTSSYGTATELPTSSRAHNPLLDAWKDGGFVVLFALFLALSIHSVIAGLALGSTSSNKMHSLVVLIIAIAFHKMLAAYGLGHAALISNTPAKRQSILFIAFSLSTPIGIIIGASLDIKSASTLGYIKAVAAGMFLFIGSSHLVEEVKENFDHAHPLLQLLFYCIGLGAMCALVLWS
eukprot:m.55697 g.55697  ORF g.55697 m.55697 type:complete len:466 (+) comp11142_c0_seq1:34-1431(+)